jgi:hypothetical protein
MTAPASAQSPSFFSKDLLATRNSDTAHLCANTWVAKLEMGIHSTIQLTQHLAAEISLGGPQRATMHALYEKVLSLQLPHAPRETDPSFAKALSEPLTKAKVLAESWYVGCIDPNNQTKARIQACPTLVAVNELMSDLRSLVAVDEDGHKALDLSAAAKPFIDRYNASCKPHQVFETPQELYALGQPLAWMVGTGIDRESLSRKPHQVVETPADLFSPGQPLEWMAAHK